MSQYAYSIQNDTLNGIADAYAIERQIQNSTITVALDHVGISGDVLTITFKATLSGPEQTTLTSVINSHDGQPVVPDPETVNLVKRTSVQDVPMVAVYKQEGTSGTIISYDWTDPCTWYEKSVRVTGESLSGSGAGPYTGANGNWIDLSHGRMTDEDSVSAPFLPAVYDNGVQKTEGTDFTIDYENGSVTFNSTPTGPVTADYSHENGSTFSLIPDPGKVLMIDHTELQFSKDVDFSGSYIDFDIYVYNPMDLPNKILYKRKRYKNIKDIINGANLGQGFIPACSGLTQDVIVFPFNYVTTQPIDSSVGAEVRVSINNDTPFTGEFATVTFYVHSVESP